LGFWPANAAQALVYSLVHLGKPPLELPASAAAGLFFCWMDERAGSVLPSVALHFMFNLLMDLFCLQALAASIAA
jgi:membrane protease YdiL (CAAX protease family)